jgi:protein-tyrosine-phosphatase
MTQKSLLFLCTGNYYRSRFAEMLFNSVAAQVGLQWRAASRGLALERGVNNIGPMDASAVEALQALGVCVADGCGRFPVSVTLGDLEGADMIVALQRSEHVPLLQERFPAWADRVEYWHIEDAPEALARIEREVVELTTRLGQG